MSETKHEPLPHLTGCYKTPLGFGIYTEPIKDLNAPEILCETQELADAVIASFNAAPKIQELLEAAKLTLPCLPGDREYAEVVAGLGQAIREVEVALKVSS